MNTDQFQQLISGSLFYGSLPRWQSRPVMRIVEEGQRRSRSIEDIAYVLATGYHETGRWKFDEEIGEGRGRDYGEPIWLLRGKRVTFHGRSDVQLTWLHNYARMSIFLTLEHGREINLVSNPDQAKEPEMSSLIIWEGMIRGMFTGFNLADFIQPGEPDYVGARQIVNGKDKAELIAGYARKFEYALRAANGGS